MTHPVRKLLGALLIVAGLILMPVPILPGIPLVLAGVALVGTDHPVIRKWSDWLRKRGKMQ
jgi:hypothetical protein